MKNNNPFGYGLEDVPASEAKAPTEMPSAPAEPPHGEPRPVAPLDRIRTLASRSFARHDVERWTRFLPIAFTQWVAAGASAIIEICPHLPFRGKLLVVSDECAPHFQVLDLKVGNVSKFMTNGTLSASCLPQMRKIDLLRMTKEQMDQWHMIFGLDTGMVTLSERIALAVVNTYGAGRMFEAALYGVALENA